MLRFVMLRRKHHFREYDFGKDTDERNMLDKIRAEVWGLYPTNPGRLIGHSCPEKLQLCMSSPVHNAIIQHA